MFQNRPAASDPRVRAMTRLARRACLALGLLSLVASGEEAVHDGGVVFQNSTFRDVPFTVAWIDLEHENLELFWKRPDGEPLHHFHGLRNWLQSEGRELVLATNAGIYAEDRTPLGLHVERGQELRPLNPHKGGRGNFALKPNGVFYIDDAGAHIRTTEDYAASGVKPSLAVQSGPLLVIANALHPKFEADSTSVYVRNGIGVRTEKRIAIVISDWPVNLHTFASFFKDELACPDALYLDGSLSGLYAAALDRTPAGAEYVGMLAVTRARKAGEEGHE